MSSESRLALIRSRFAARSVILPVSAGEFRPVPSARHSATCGGTIFRATPLRETFTISRETDDEIRALCARPVLSADAEKWIANGWSGAGPIGDLP